VITTAEAVVLGWGILMLLVVALVAAAVHGRERN
jgi:hypothetical protein